MLRLSCLVATGVLALTVGAANADTVFDVSGTIDVIVAPPVGLPTSTLGGTIHIDTAGGTIGIIDVTFTSPSAEFTVPPLTFNGPETGSNGANTYDIELCAASDCSSNWLINMLVDVTNPGPTSLVGYAGGPIYSIGLFYGGIADTWGSCQASSFTSTTCGSLVAPSPIPLPTALPLFATGLGAMGLLGWRRKRKAQAAV